MPGVRDPQRGRRAVLLVGGGLGRLFVPLIPANAGTSGIEDVEKKGDVLAYAPEVLSEVGDQRAAASSAPTGEAAGVLAICTGLHSARSASDNFTPR